MSSTLIKKPVAVLSGPQRLDTATEEYVGIRRLQLPQLVGQQTDQKYQDDITSKPEHAMPAQTRCSDGPETAVKIEQVIPGLEIDAKLAKPQNRSARWTWEILATILSVTSQVAVIVIVFSMQNKPLDRWRWFININTSVSALITTAKSSMLFSVAACLGQLKWIYFSEEHRQLRHFGLLAEAGKGPLGATQVLCSIRWTAAWLGAAVVVLALFFDPFAQQVIGFETRDAITASNESATLGLTHNYTYGAKQSPVRWYREISDGELTVVSSSLPWD
jgi:hypothetical protein